MRGRPERRSLAAPLQRPLYTAVARRVGSNQANYGFDPQILFTGKSGAIYEISDINTLFADSPGVTAPSVNGPIGLFFDKSQRLTLGDEKKASGIIAISGSASAATYNTSTGVGSVTRVDISNQSYVYWSGLQVSIYRLDISNSGPGGIAIRNGLGLQSGAVWHSVPAGQSAVVYVLALDGYIAITASAPSGTASFTINSLKILSGNHIFQNTAAARSTLRGNPTGESIAVNGGFDSGAGWTINYGAEISGGKLNFSSLDAVAAAENVGQVVAGRVYKARLTISGYVTGAVSLANGIGITSVGSVYLGNGTFEQYFTATQTGSISIRARMGATTLSVDNFTLQEASAGLVTKPYFSDADGTDDAWLCASAGGGTTGFLLQTAIKLDAINKRQTIWSDAGTNTGYNVEINASNQLVFSAGNGTAYTSVTTTNTIAAGTTSTVECYDDGTNLVAILNGGTPATAARPAVSAGTAGFTMQKDNGAASGFMDGLLCSVIYLRNTALEIGQRAQAMNWIRKKAGL